MMRMAMRRPCDHPSTGPSGVAGQSNARIRPAISLSPGNTRARMSSRMRRRRVIEQLGGPAHRQDRLGATNPDSGRSLETLDGWALRHVLRRAVVEACAILCPGAPLALEDRG